MPGWEDRIQRLEDRQEIQDLPVRYGFAVDEHELEAVKALFTPDGCLRTKTGPPKGQGRDGVGEYFAGRFAVLGPTNHFVHGHVIDFDDDDPTVAVGLVSSHAEVYRDGAPMITAMRYHDRYRKLDGKWLFEERVQSYMYFVDAREYPEALGHELRMRTSPDDWKPADWPYVLASAGANGELQRPLRT